METPKETRPIHSNTLKIMKMIRCPAALVSFLLLNAASAYIVEKRENQLSNLLSPEQDTQQTGAGLAPVDATARNAKQLQAVGQQGLQGETNDLLKRLNLGCDYAAAPPPSDAVAEVAKTVQEQLKPSRVKKIVKGIIVHGWDVAEEEDDEEGRLVRLPEEPLPEEIMPAAKEEEESMITAVDDFTAKFAERKPVVSMYPPVTTGPTVNLKPNMKPAFVADEEEAPTSTTEVFVTRRTREVQDTNVLVHNEKQEIPFMEEKEKSTASEEHASRLRELNKQAVTGQSEYFANRYSSYDNWFDNPNSNNLFLRAMHIEN